MKKGRQTGTHTSDGRKKVPTLADVFPPLVPATDLRPSVKVKLLLLGDKDVGKTEVFNRYVYNEFTKTSVTIGGYSKTTKRTFRNLAVNLEIWDTGERKYDSLIEFFCRGANAAILCYNITDHASFQGLQHWLDMIEQVAQKNCAIVVLGLGLERVEANPAARKVEFVEAKRYASSIHAIAMEASAKKDYNINEAFEQVVHDYLDARGKPSRTRHFAVERGSTLQRIRELLLFLPSLVSDLVASYLQVVVCYADDAQGQPATATALSASDFIVMDLLGAGMNGAVFSVHCTQRGREQQHFALKIPFNVHGVTESQLTNRFNNEYEILRHLQEAHNFSPFVMRYWADFRSPLTSTMTNLLEKEPKAAFALQAAKDYQERKGKPLKFKMIVLDEYYTDLRTWIASRTNVSHREFGLLAHGLFQGILFLQKHQITHRDIKPENIFLTHDGRPVLGDFGTALFMKQLRVTCSPNMNVEGTQRYCPPDLLNSYKSFCVTQDTSLVLDFTQADFFAVLVTLCECALGCYPLEPYPSAERGAPVSFVLPNYHNLICEFGDRDGSLALWQFVRPYLLPFSSEPNQTEAKRWTPPRVLSTLLTDLNPAWSFASFLEKVAREASLLRLKVNDERASTIRMRT